MFRQTTFMALLLLLIGPSMLAADSSEEKAEHETASITEDTRPELDLIAILGALEGISALRSASSSAESTEAEGAVATEDFGGCYTGCNPQFDSICPAGMVAEITATGPIRNCGLADIQCVDRCLGPIVSCSSFATCF